MQDLNSLASIQTRIEELQREINALRADGFQLNFYEIGIKQKLIENLIQQGFDSSLK